MRGILVLFLLAGSAIAAHSATLLVLNKEDATLAIIDPSSGQVLGKVPTGESPHEVAASTDGRYAFVANYGSREPGSTISVIDVPARKEIRRVNLGPLRRPHGIAFFDGKVYFTAETNRLIGRYDPESNQIDWLMGTGQAGTHMVKPSGDGSKIFTANIGSDSITIFERTPGPAGWNATVVSVGKGPEGFDVSPDGKELWAAHSRDGGISIVDVAEKKVAAAIDAHTRRSNRLKFTPDGRHVLVSDMEAGELVVLDAAARKEVKRLKLGRGVEGILVVPDGSRAFVAVAGENKVVAVDLATFSVTSSISPGSGPDGMAWIADRH